ncbi:MAG: hypothetical protein ACRDHN_11975 [Thermomicrobiales bacterium]
MNLTTATERAMQIRRLYQQFELRDHGAVWTTGEDMLGLVSDVGYLARLVMAAEGRWDHDENLLPAELKGKLAECLWWILVLSNRLGIDVTEAFASTMDKIELGLASADESPDALTP